eukprot:scaffold239975_cov21-Tisochrysis_lutea.AAC.2
MLLPRLAYCIKWLRLHRRMLYADTQMQPHKLFSTEGVLVCDMLSLQAGQVHAAAVAGQASAACA